MSAMGSGIKYLKITTDPVELWAAPNSQSRIEKEFFDSHFEPFYRIEQLIIRSDAPPVIHNSSDEIIEFGPAFDRDFLLEVLDLQNGIKGMLMQNFIEELFNSLMINICLIYSTGRRNQS